MGACLACFACQACAGVSSICCSCLGCGGGSKNTPMVGRVRALALMLMSVVLAVVGQYWLYDYFDSLDAWEDGCTNAAYTEENRDVCIGNSAVYRVSFVDSVFFLVMALCACCSTAFNNGFWGFKFSLWALLLIACLFISNDVFDTTGYVWPARIGAFVFTIMQQLVLIDLAYRINDGLVAKANEYGENTSEGRPFLSVLVAASVILYAGSLSAVGAMFHYFSGCPQNDLVLSLSLIMPIVVTVLQLSGGEGNLLTSAVVTAYTSFLCFSAVSKTPKSSCNPFVGESNTSVVIIGIGLTILSLFWVTLNAARTVTALLGGGGDKVEEVDGPVSLPPSSSIETGGDKAQPFAQGGSAVAGENGERTASSPSTGEEVDDGGLGWRFNIVMVLISMFYAMMLTNWGDVSADEDSSDPKNGWTAMWLTTTGQWVCFLIYAWTLVAPRAFPDRDFS